MTLQEFEKQVESSKPRFFDTYLLAPYMMWYAVNSRDMPKRWRRVLFTGGVWTVYRNWSEYKQAVARAKMALVQQKEPELPA